MIRGTTPELEFTLPFDTKILAEVWVTLCQNGEEVITKILGECTCKGKLLTVRLTQEETLRLHAEIVTEIQIRARTVYDDAIASNVIEERTDKILKDGVI